MKRTGKLFVIILIFAAISGFSNDTAWKLAIDKQGINVYTRPVKGFPLDEFRGITVIKASLETIERVLRDVKAQPQWMADCRHARILKTFNKNHLVCYNVIHLPWPLDNRDLLIDTKIVKKQDGKKLEFIMSVFPEDITPVSKKYVRVRQFKALCKVEEISKNLCSVEYINRINPMAPLPDSLASRFARNNPFNTLKGMKKMVLLKKYNTD